jgi:phosphoenolpyruvate-protein kinase (PTS system EI component)
MLEVAAAAVMTDLWAAQVDFFALGTNDLTASMLGVDRDDPVAASLSDPLHPGMLRLVAEVIRAAHRAERWVTVCGEMAASPEGAAALTALGVDSLSVAVGQLHTVRKALADLDLTTIRELPAELGRLRTADQVRQLLRHVAVMSS